MKKRTIESGDFMITNNGNKFSIVMRGEDGLLFEDGLEQDFSGLTKKNIINLYTVLDNAIKVWELMNHNVDI